MRTRRYSRNWVSLLTVFLLTISQNVVLISQANAVELIVAQDKVDGYERSKFKHWIDADKDGCDTRAEVLIEEAVVKPKIGPKCKIIGGQWIALTTGNQFQMLLN